MRSFTSSNGISSSPAPGVNIDNDSYYRSHLNGKAILAASP
ncbi:hypothetical protein HMPREF9946_04574 [Acetobacteraceae bacterium AT-5844]|nr:hypothetical protein HMPREF9946_04574 [Acetobacteraceae bacterium AT-5844]